MVTVRTAGPRFCIARTCSAIPEEVAEAGAEVVEVVERVLGVSILNCLPPLHDAILLVSSSPGDVCIYKSLSLQPMAAVGLILRPALIAFLSLLGTCLHHHWFEQHRAIMTQGRTPRSVGKQDHEAKQKGSRCGDEEAKCGEHVVDRTESTESSPGCGESGLPRRWGDRAWGGDSSNGSWVEDSAGGGGSTVRTSESGIPAVHQFGDSLGLPNSSIDLRLSGLSLVPLCCEYLEGNMGGGLWTKLDSGGLVEFRWMEKGLAVPWPWLFLFGAVCSEISEPSPHDLTPP